VKQTTAQKVDLLLDRAKLKKTRCRIDVLTALLRAKKPLTQHEITARLNTNAPDKVTIYRILEAFLEAGLIHHAYIKNRISHYELAHNCSEKQCHPHFTCTCCGATTCLVNAKVPLAKKLDDGYVVHHQQVKLQGLCPKCA